MSLDEILKEDRVWYKEFHSMKVTGNCNGLSCKNEAKHWFGNTSQAHCGRAECIEYLEYEYNKPTIGRT